MTLADDQHVVQALAAQRSHEPFRIGVAPHRQMHPIRTTGTDLEERVTAHLAAIPASRGADADGVTGPGAGRAGDAAALPAADRLDEIPGRGREAAAALIAEIDLDMSRFPPPEALVSRAGPTPAARQSGPRKGRGKKGHGNTRVLLCGADHECLPGTSVRSLDATGRQGFSGAERDWTAEAGHACPQALRLDGERISGGHRGHVRSRAEVRRPEAA